MSGNGVTPRRLVYLDHAATTPLDAHVLDAMLPYLRGSFGNPSATYTLAKEAASAVETSRRTVAGVLGVRPRDVVFTGGGTESINAAIKGVAFAQRHAGRGNHIVTSTIEHHAVLHTCQYLERFGFEITYVPANGRGMINPDDVARAMTDETALVSIMAANNEVGTIEPVDEIARTVSGRARTLGRRVPFHTDAVQAPNSLPLESVAASCDLVSLSAHKFAGPKGVGVLSIARGVPFLSQQTGGGQERQRRAGTENVAGIVGAATALLWTQQSRATEAPRIRRMSERLGRGVTERVPRTRLNGEPSCTLVNNVSITFVGADARELLGALDAAGVACSAGAVCGATTMEPSHVLLAMGMSLEDATCTLRFSPGHATTDDDIDHVLDVLPAIVERVRATRMAAAH